MADPSLFSVADILNWSSLCLDIKFEAHEDDPSPGKRIWNLLPSNIQSLVERSADGSHLSEEDKCNIVNALNDILERQDFYHEPDFANTKLSPKVKEILARDQDDLSITDVHMLNRLLMEVSYPKEIVKSLRKAEWEKPEPCPKMAHAAMLMNKFELMNRYPLSRRHAPPYSKSQLSNIGRTYTKIRDLLLEAAGKVGATREERRKGQEDTTFAAELLLVLLGLRRNFRLPPDTLPPLTGYERRLGRLKYAGFVAESPSLLSEDDDIELPSLIKTLNDIAQQDQPNPGKRIWDLLPEKVRALFKKLNGVKKVPKEEDLSTIIDALNNVLKRRDFYREEDFSTVELSQEVKELLKRNRDDLTIREVRKLNRLLFDYVFTFEIDASHKGDIRNWRQFCEKLVSDTQGKKRHPGKAIWEHLTPRVRNLISETASLRISG